MWNDVNSLSGVPRRRRLIVFASIASLLAVSYSLALSLLAPEGLSSSGLIGDVFVYSDVAALVIDGAIPYVDADVEHLPIALVPLLGIQLLSNLTGIPIWLAWPSVMSVAFVVSVLFVDRIDGEHPAGFRFIAVSLPLLPLALFRLEPWIVLLAVTAIVSFLGRRVVLGFVLVVAGTLGKGWPIIISILPWKHGRRMATIASLVVSLALLFAVAAQDGFQSGRSFEGIHSETLVGSVVLLSRHLFGQSLQTFLVAGARYVQVPTWLVLVNAIPGVVVGITAVIVARRDLVDRTIISLIGYGVLGIVLLSPLFSTQFLIWLTPFVAGISFTSRRVYVGAAVVGLLSVTAFAPESLLWAIEAVLVNALILILAFRWTGELLNPMRTGRVQDPSASSKNLPV